MSLLTQVIYNIPQNQIIRIKTNPVGRYGISAGMDANVIKFFPTGTSEELYYEVDVIDHRVEELPEKQITYFWCDPANPTSQVYSLLNTNTQQKDWPSMIDASNIILGTMPNIVGISWSSSNENQIGGQFGLVYKDAQYDGKIWSIKQLMMNEHTDLLSFTQSVASISNNRSQENFKVYASGSIICPWEPYEGGSNGAHVKGFKYTSKGYTIDYYNQVIIPLTITSVMDATHSEQVRLYINAREMDSGYTTYNFLTETNSVTTNTYKYYGSDPLLTDTVNEVNISGPSLVDLNSFKVYICCDQQGTFNSVIIANKANDLQESHTSSYTEISHSNFECEEHSNIKFYKRTDQVSTRVEDCISTTINGVKVIFPCTRGLGPQQGLTNLITLMKQSDRDPLIQSCHRPSYEEASQYKTKVSGSMQPLTWYLNQNYSLHEFNLKLTSAKEKLETNTTNLIPLGQSMSWQTSQSERVGDITQDRDSKSGTGGGCQFKTFTQPTYTEYACAGGGYTPKPVGYNGAVFMTPEDIQTLANNFYDINEELSNVSVMFKGTAYIGDFEYVVDDDHIIDKIVWDIGNNTTTYTCRTVLFN